MLGASVATLIASLLLRSSSHLLAVPATWSATPSEGNWVPLSGDTNWSAGINNFPGATAGTANTDTAAFSSGSALTSVMINSSTLNIGSITFSGAASAFTIGSTGGNSLFLSSGGTIQTTNTVSNAETVNAPLALEGTYAFSSNAVSTANTLNIGGGITGASGAATLTLKGTNTGANTVSGIIGNGASTALSLTKTGSGTWTLTGANTYTGVTTVSAGVLSVSSLANGGSASNIGAASSAASNLVLNGGTLQYTGNSVTIDRGFTASSNSVINVSTSGQTLTMSGAVSVNGGGSGGSGLIIMGNLTLTGTVSLDNIPPSNNALDMAAGATLTTSGTVTNPAGNNVFQGGTLIVAGGTFTTETITALGNAANIAGSTLTVSGGLFNQNGGQFLLGQSDAGTVNLNGGTFETSVQLQSFVTGNALNFNGGTLQLSASLANLLAAPADVTMTVNSGGAVIDVNGHTLTINNALLAGSGNGGLTLNSTAGGGTLTLSGASTYTGATTINAGTIALGISNALPIGTALSVTGALDLAGFSQQVASVTGSGIVTDSGGAGAFKVNNPAADSFAGTITGTNLSLVKQGAGTLALGGANSYQGGTIVNGGALLVNNKTGSATGSGPVAVNSGGTLGGSGTIAGAVTLNSGGTIAPGAGSPGAAGATLHAASLTWNGGGTVNLQLGSSTSDQLAVTGALTKGTAGPYTLTISNAGIQQSGYTLATFASTTFLASDFTLTLPTGYGGALLETATSLNLVLTFATTGPIIQNSGPVGTPLIADFTVKGPVMTGTMTQNNTINSLIFTPSGALTIYNTLFVTSGNVTDGGGMTTITGGTLSSPNGLFFDLIGEMIVESKLQGNLTKTGPGSLILNGALVGNAQVLQGLLGGTGSISGNLYNNGTVAPGDAPGTLTVGGNYTQTHTASLVIEVRGTQSGQFDVLAVGGKANLDGRLRLVQLNNLTLGRGVKINFLTAGQGISGTFASVINPFVSDTILEPTVIYGPNSVALEAIQGSFKTLAQNARLAPNEVSVGGALDSVVSDPRANPLISYLDARSLNKLPGDLVKIDPEQLTSMFTVGISLANVQSLNIQRRTDDIRSGSSGFSAARLALNGDGPNYSGSFDITTGVAGPTGLDGKESKEEKDVAPAAPVDQRWGAFLSGTGQWVNVGDTNNARGYNLDSGGFTLGVDYKACEHFAVGLSFGYTGTTVDLADRGRIFVNGGKTGIYSTAFFGGWYADAAVNGGFNSYETHRTALQGQASGAPDGGELNGVFGTGYDFKKGALTFGPTAAFNYTYVGLGDFTERGSLAPLNIHGGDEQSLRTALGAKVKYDWKIGGVLIKPELRVAWQHEFGDTAYALDSNFANGAGSSFLVNGPAIGRDSLLLSGGFAIQLSERWSAYVYYDGELARTNYQSSSVSGGFSVEF